VIGHVNQTKHWVITHIVQCSRIPEHLINLFDKSKGELDEQEQTQLSELLCEFEDVFAKSEFDLGKWLKCQDTRPLGAMGTHP
jgi:hypothetical protein